MKIGRSKTGFWSANFKILNVKNKKFIFSSNFLREQAKREILDPSILISSHIGLYLTRLVLDLF